MDSEVRELENRLNQHINGYQMDKLRDEARWDKMLSAQETNTHEVAILTESTRSLVEGWRTATSLGQFLKWLSGFAILGFIIPWIADIIK
jgi:hypothetical protein